MRSSRAALPVATVRARRNRGLLLFERFGLPHRRVEAWKYTDLRTLMRTVAPLAGVRRPIGWRPLPEADALASLDRAQIVIANGVFEPELSDLAGTDGVTVESLAHEPRHRPSGSDGSSTMATTR